MPNFYFTSYCPLIASMVGRAAAISYGLAPFVDGSIRREPDLEHPLPAITCLCRADKFAPRLQVGDVVVYVTKKAKYLSEKEPHRRLTAVLQVQSILPSHAAAAAWYKSHEVVLPNNCMVDGNPAKPLEQSHRIAPDRAIATGTKLWKLWDKGYRQRSQQFGTVVVCRPLFVELGSNAPVVDDAKLIAVFGHVPSTQNPGKQTIEQFRQLVALVKLPVSEPLLVADKSQVAFGSVQTSLKLAKRPQGCSPSRRSAHKC